MNDIGIIAAPLATEDTKMSDVPLLLTVGDGNGVIRFEQRGGSISRTFSRMQAPEGSASRPDSLRESSSSGSENPVGPAIPFHLLKDELSAEDLQVLGSEKLAVEPPYPEVDSIVV